MNPAVVDPALAIAFLVVMSWLQHRRCTCERRGTMLRPNWKVYKRKGRR